MPRDEMLMMGFAQITGSFTVDGSLVSQRHFEDVKGRVIVPGQGGGGLVRTQSAKRDSGLFATLGWRNFGETFGGLLGDSGMSSMKDAKKWGNKRSIPIFSAPQSILFVNLRLAPGESKSYRFSHPLPRGIPPSHRGQGEILGHDLMSPHTILSSVATVTEVDPLNLPEVAADPKTVKSKPKTSADEFTYYVNELLNQPEQSTDAALLSPTEDDPRLLPSLMYQADSMKEVVDSIILNNNSGSTGKRNVNRFEIARSGDKVAVVMLTRAAYRLGETIYVAIDFQGSSVFSYSLHATLETSETIDPTIALRSRTSIQRMTRRIIASHFERTISAERVHFNPKIPSYGTPEFMTSGISHEWKLRFQFVTHQSTDTEILVCDCDRVMEEVCRDKRGIAKAAVRRLPCEAFEVKIPLRVYGATAAFDANTDSGSFPI
ncbi:MAG: hypothetical protein Q9163_006267 [Psora crenata]